MHRIRSAKSPGEPAPSIELPMCYYCSSTDTMEPFARSDHAFLVSTLFPRVRVRYCRQCTRHFLSVTPRPGT